MYLLRLLAAKNSLHSPLKRVQILSPRLLAEPWRQEERCVRAGENESPRRLSSAVSPVYSTRSNKHFDTTGTQRSFEHSTTKSLLYESPLRSLLETANRPDADDRLLSHIEMSRHENSYLETRTRERMPHGTYTGLYILEPLSILFWLAPVRRRKGRLPGQTLSPK